MEGNEFKNGLIGHRVEGKMYDKTIQGVYVGQALDDDGHQWDRIVTDTGDILCVIATRVIRPQGEAPKSAEPNARHINVVLDRKSK
jgi:hypothetical protein